MINLCTLTGKSDESSNWPGHRKVCWFAPCRLRSFVWTCPRNPAVFLLPFCNPCRLAHGRRRTKACGPYSARFARTSGNSRHMQVVFPNPFASDTSYDPFVRPSVASSGFGQLKTAVIRFKYFKKYNTVLPDVQ